MILGYTRTSHTEPGIDQQCAALRAAGAVEIYADRDVLASAVLKPELKRCAIEARHGDTIIVTQLDRLAHSLRDIIEILGCLHARGIGFRSLDDGIDIPYDDAGQSTLLTALFRFERGTAQRRAEQASPLPSPSLKRVGRPSRITPDRWRTVKAMLAASPPITTIDAARMLGITRQALHKRLKAERDRGEA